MTSKFRPNLHNKKIGFILTLSKKTYLFSHLMRLQDSQITVQIPKTKRNIGEKRKGVKRDERNQNLIDLKKERTNLYQVDSVATLLQKPLAPRSVQRRCLMIFLEIVATLCYCLPALYSTNPWCYAGPMSIFVIFSPL